jgi:hypothetical protein
MQARAVIGVTDIHARALADRIKAFENLDRICAVVGTCLWVAFASEFCHAGAANEFLKERESPT